MDAIETWYKSIMQFARENYNFYGWDNFVECVDLSDFRRDAKEHGWEFQSDAFEHYKMWCELKAEQQEEHDAEARSSW